MKRLCLDVTLNQLQLPELSFTHNQELRLEPESSFNFLNLKFSENSQELNKRVNISNLIVCLLKSRGNTEIHFTLVYQLLKSQS